VLTDKGKGTMPQSKWA